MNEVFLVIRGFDYDGFCILRIFQTAAEAVQFVERLIVDSGEQAFGDYITVERGAIGDTPCLIEEPVARWTSIWDIEDAALKVWTRETR
jgi:hypothetical protein